MNNLSGRVNKKISSQQYKVFLQQTFTAFSIVIDNNIMGTRNINMGIYIDMDTICCDDSIK